MWYISQQLWPALHVLTFEGHQCSQSEQRRVNVAPSSVFPIRPRSAINSPRATFASVVLKNRPVGPSLLRCRHAVGKASLGSGPICDNKSKCLSIIGNCNNLHVYCKVRIVETMRIGSCAAARVGGRGVAREPTENISSAHVLE